MPQDFESICNLAKILFDSGYYQDTKSAAQAVVKVLAGRELGFGPIASMTGVHVIEGKPSVGAHLMASLIKRSGKYDYKVLRLDREACELEFFEVGGKRESVGRVSVTLKEFIDSGVAIGKDGRTKKNWQSSPDDMLFARAVSKGYRRYCPDLNGGVVIYTPDELDNDHAGEVIDASFSVNGAPLSTPTAPLTGITPEPQRISDAQHEELSALLRDTSTDVSKLLVHYASKFGASIPVLKKLPAVYFDEIKATLVKRLAERKAASAPTVPMVCVSAEQAARLQQLAIANKVNERDMLEFLGVPIWGAVPAAAHTWVRLQLEGGADPHQLPTFLKVKTLAEIPAQRLESMTLSCLSERIDKLVLKTKVSQADWTTRLQQLFGHTDSTKLTAEQMLELEGRLAAYEKKLAAQGSAA